VPGKPGTLYGKTCREIHVNFWPSPCSLCSMLAHKKRPGKPGPFFYLRTRTNSDRTAHSPERKGPFLCPAPARDHPSPKDRAAQNAEVDPSWPEAGCF